MEVIGLDVSFEKLKEEYKTLGKELFIKRYNKMWYEFLEDILKGDKDGSTTNTK